MTTNKANPMKLRLSTIKPLIMIRSGKSSGSKEKTPLTLPK
jgi:hypothetical protein